MLKLLTKTSLLACLTFGACAQSFIHAPTANYLGQGSIGICHASPYSLNYNPALLSESKNLEIGLNLSNTFAIAALNYSSLEIHHRQKGCAWGFWYSNLSTTYFRQHAMTLGLGKSLTEKWKTGISISSQKTSINESTPAWNYSYSIGLTYQYHAQLLLAAVLEEDGGMKAACLYQAADFLGFLLQYQKNKLRSEWSLAIIYQPMSRMQIKSAYRLSQNILSFGVHYPFQSLSIDLGFAFGHPLGMDSAVGISYISHE